MNKSYAGYYKVNEDGFSLTSATFYNPETKHSFSKIVWDLDNDNLLYDEEVQVLRNLPYSEKYRWMWLHELGVIQTGDIVEVYKGRKVPIGTVSKVMKIVSKQDRYKRWVCDYAYLENGLRTNVNNCRFAN